MFRAEYIENRKGVYKGFNATYQLKGTRDRGGGGGEREGVTADYSSCLEQNTLKTGTGFTRDSMLHINLKVHRRRGRGMRREREEGGKGGGGEGGQAEGREGVTIDYSSCLEQNTLKTGRGFTRDSMLHINLKVREKRAQ